MDIPKYKHDCDKCTYLGDFDNYDLYYCDGIIPTVVARYGNEPPSYYSGLPLAKENICPPLYEARQRAIQQNLLK